MRPVPYPLIWKKNESNDVAGSVAVTSIGAFPAIALSETVNDAIYTTYIYCYDGYLREITVSDGTTVLPGDGQKIIETKHLPLIWSAQIFTALPLRIRPDTPIRFISH